MKVNAFRLRRLICVTQGARNFEVDIEDIQDIISYSTTFYVFNIQKRDISYCVFPKHIQNKRFTFGNLLSEFYNTNDIRVTVFLLHYRVL